MSYAAKYIVPFRTIDEILCEIRFDVKGYTGVAKELIGGGDPIRVEVDTSDILTPIRSSSATISVYGSDYLQDLYTSDPFGIKVTLIVGGSVKWLGYVTQDTFSQDFSSPEFIYEIECVSAISVLKHKKFKSDNPTISFLEIIKEAVSLAGYNKAYLTNTVRTITDGNLFSSAKVASANFFDELGEADTYYKALEEIAKYTTCTFTPFGADLMLLNYEAIKAGENFYYRIDSGAITAVKFEHETTVQQLGYKGTGATISRITGKNKAVVNCSLNEITEVMHDINSDGMLFGSSSEYIHTQNDESTTVVEQHYWGGDASKFETYLYPTSDGTPPPLGAEYVGVAEFPTDDPPVELNLEDRIVVYRGDNGTEIPNYPIVTIRSKSNVVTSTGDFIVLDMETKTTKNSKYGLGKESGYTFKYDRLIIYEATLRVGDKYYSGGRTWSSTETTFEVHFRASKDDGLNMWRNVINENRYDTALGGARGKLIPVPEGLTVGDVELTLHSFVSSDIDAEVKWEHIRNISLEIATPDAQSIYGDYVNENSKNDVIYEREIAGDYVEEAEEVDLNISTKTDGKISLSSVFTDSGYITEYKHLGVNIQPEHNILNKIIRLYQQPRFVINPTLANNLKPYSLITDSNLPNVQFINGGGEEDVKMGRVTTNLIQI